MRDWRAFRLCPYQPRPLLGGVHLYQLAPRSRVREGAKKLAKPEMVSFCVLGVTRHTPQRLFSAMKRLSHFLKQKPHTRWTNPTTTTMCLRTKQRRQSIGRLYGENALQGNKATKIRGASASLDATVGHSGLVPRVQKNSPAGIRYRSRSMTGLR